MSGSKGTLDWAKANAQSWWIQTSTLAPIKSELRLWSSTTAGSKVITHHVHALHSLPHSFPPLSSALSRPSMQSKTKGKKGKHARCVTRPSSTVLMQLDGKFDCTTMAKGGEFIIRFGCVCIMDLCAVWRALQLCSALSRSLSHTHTHTHTYCHCERRRKRRRQDGWRKGDPTGSSFNRSSPEQMNLFLLNLDQLERTTHTNQLAPFRSTFHTHSIRANNNNDNNKKVHLLYLLTISSSSSP